MIWFIGYLVFLLILFSYIIYAVKHAPSDIELWGEEID